MKMVHRNNIYLIPKSQEPKMNIVEARDFFLIFWPAIDREPCGRTSVWIHPNTWAKVVYHKHQPNNIHFQLKNIPRRACSVILSFKLYIICADSGISTRLHSYGAGKYMRISLFLFGMYMVTSIDIKFYLHYGVDEQVSNKAGLPHLAANKFTALKAGRCLLLITAQPG